MAFAAMGIASAALTLPAAATSTTTAGGPHAAASSPSGTGSATTARTAVIGGAELAAPGIVVNYPSASSPRLPDVPDSAYVIADASTGQVLASKDAHGPFPPASTLKVLTAVTLIPLLNPDSTVVASRRAASVEPNIVGLVPGQRYRIDDLFRALLMISANDAAVSLAEATGSFDKGMALMNAEARRLQAYDVVAKVPNGLPAAGQQVSAYDLALIARQALTMPAFMKYDDTLSATFPITPHKIVGMANQDSILTEYSGGIGGKIGWTEAAGATYIGLARRNGVTLIVTELRCTPLTEIASAERLLDWGFSMAGHIKPVGVLVPPLAAPAGLAAGAHAGAKPGRAGSRAGTAASGGLGADLTSPPGLLALTIGLGCCAIIVTLLMRRRTGEALLAAEAAPSALAQAALAQAAPAQAALIPDDAEAGGTGAPKAGAAAESLLDQPPAG